MSRSIWVLLAGLCAFVALALLWPGRGGDFIFDDLPNIVDNSRVHVTALTWESLKQAAFSYEPGGGSRPLAMLSFALDHWRAGGLLPIDFKDTNLAIHGLTVVALAALLRRVLVAANWSAPQAAWFSLGVTLIWAIHPVQVSAVLYVVQRMQTLSTFFTVLALLAYVNGRMARQHGRLGAWHWVLLIASVILGVASKEDMVLLPLYMLALELSVLGFEAPTLQERRWLQRGYGLFVVLSALVFVAMVVPRYWHADPYPYRDFTSLERLLTQARVLAMYLSQVIIPLPSRLPFYYDDLVPSRGLLDPPETLIALAGLVALMACAWAWRKQRPVFSLGVFLFFAGHAMTSNILNLEMAFEHRNHVPMIGALLAAGDLMCMLLDRLEASRGLRHVLSLILVIAFGGCTFLRAGVWGSPLHFAMEGVELAPGSARAWQLLSKAYYLRSGGDPEHPFFSFSIYCSQRAADLPGALVPLADLITLKAIQGQDASADWFKLQGRLRTAVFTVEGRDVIWVLIGNANKGVPLDAHQMALAIDGFASRMPLTASQWANLADYLLYRSPEPSSAFAYYQKALRGIGPGEQQLKGSMLRDLEKHGMKEWADRLRQDRAASMEPDN